MRRAVETARGFSWALGAPVDPAAYESLAGSAAAAQDMEFAERVKRREAAALARFGIQ